MTLPTPQPPHEPSRTSRLVICGRCPYDAVLPTTNPDHDSDLCLRCQHRRLPRPHDEDHLCDICRKDCPTCRNPRLTKNSPCRTCTRTCLHCHATLPAADPNPPPTDTHPGSHTRSNWDNLCPACRNPHQPHTPTQRVLAALPHPLIRALGGTLPADLITLIHDELHVRTATELIDRIERRWGTRWARIRPRIHPNDTQPDSLPPHELTHNLLAPTDCPQRCEDGWSRDLHTPCPTCRNNRHTAVAERRTRQTEFADETTPTPDPPTDRTTTEAISHRPTTYTECDGRNGSCGLPVRPPHTRCPPCRGWTRCLCGTHHDPNQDCPTCAAL